ncbi:MAG: hypothetical protein U0746_08805 [Gemmataceae bacterium]
MIDRFVVPRRRAAAGRLTFAILVASIVGCGAKVGDVAGKVTHQGKTVVCGTVIFVGPDGMTKTANLNQDGTFLVKSVGAGRAQVAVISLDPARPLDPYKAERTHGKQVTEPTDDSGRDPNAGRVVKSPPNDRSNWTEPNVDRSKWFPLPQKYELVHTSGVTVELKPGPNEGIVIELP